MFIMNITIGYIGLINTQHLKIVVLMYCLFFFFPLSLYVNKEGAKNKMGHGIMKSLDALCGTRGGY